MPCTVTDAEIEDYNRRKYGIELTDEAMLIYFLCIACKQIEEFGLQVSDEHLRNWWTEHKKEDEKR
jgi:hypothetical protein